MQLYRLVALPFLFLPIIVSEREQEVFQQVPGNLQTLLRPDIAGITEMNAGPMAG